MRPASALLALHVAVALFGLAALFGKWLALSSTAIVLGRTLVGALTLALVARARRQPLGRPDSGLLWNGPLLALHWVTFFAAVRVASVAVALLGYASFPVFVLFIERTMHGRALRPVEYATALLATLGLAALAADGAWSTGSARGLAIALVSGFTFALLVVRNRRLVATRSAVSIAMWQNLAAGICVLPIVAIAERASAWPDGRDAVLLVVLGVVCTGLAHTFFIASMRRVSAHSASVVAALEPVYGIALAAWLLDEKLDLPIVAGGVMIVTAAIVASRRVQ